MALTLDEAVNTMTQFGQEILTPKEGVPIIVPKISVSVEVLLSLFEKPKGDESSPFEVGFFNMIHELVSESWKSLTIEQQQNIKTNIIKFAQLNMNKKSVGHFTALCIEIYRLSESNWEELVNFIFSSPVTIIKGKMFIRFMENTKSAFVEEHRTQISDMVESSFSLEDTSISSGLIAILSNLDCEEVFKSHPNLINILYKSIFQILEDQPARCEFILLVVVGIFVQAPAAGDSIPEALDEAINNIKDVETAKKVLQIAPLLPADAVITVIKKLISVADNLISTTNRIPNTLIEAIDHSPIDNFSDEVQERLANLFSEKLSKSDSIAAITVFAPLAAQIADVLGKDKLIELIDKCFNGQPIYTSAALRILQCISEYIDNLDINIPESTVSRIFGYFGNIDASVRSAAFAAARSFMVNSYVLDKEGCTALITAFAKTPESDRPQFFKVVREAFRSEVNEELPMIAAEFAFKGLKTEKDPLLQSEYLSIIINAVNIQPDLIDDEIEAVLTASSNLIKGDEPGSYRYATRALVLLAMTGDDKSRRLVFALLPRFQALLAEGSKIPPKVQGNVAASYATIVINCEVKKKYKNVVELTTRFATSGDSHLVSAGSMIAEMLCECIDNKTGSELTQILAETARHASDVEQLNNLLSAVRKLLKSFEIEEEVVKPLFYDVISGAHPIFMRQSPAAFNDKNTKIYSFLKIFVTKFQSEGEQTAAVVVGWLSAAPISMFPRILSLIDQLVLMGSIKGECSDELAETLFQRISGQNEGLDDDMLGILMEVVKADPSRFDPDRFVAKLLNIWQEIADADPSPWRACVAKAILELCAVGAEMDDEIIKSVLGDFPYDKDFEVADAMGAALVKMMDSKKFETAAPFVAKTFCDVLLLPNEELKEYNFGKDTINDMKRVTKTILRANKTLEREIQRSFGKNRPLQNRFSKLMK